MGNEMSMEGGAQGSQGNLGGVDFGASIEQDTFFSSHQGPEATECNDYDDIKPMDEAELNRQLKLSTADVDVHNTGVSEQLKQLLATLHEGPHVSLSTHSTPGTTFSKPAFSAAAQEFVPGKPFTLPMAVERERSVALSEAGSDSRLAGTFNTEAPEFVPSWQKGASVAAGASTGSSTGLLPLATPVAAAAVSAAAGVRVIDKKVWWYRDPQGAVRGPFSTTEMRAWADKGYFSGGLEIALSDRGPYLPLSSVYPSPERPFWKSIEPREFATRMRQHILATRTVMAGDAE